MSSPNTSRHLQRALNPLIALSLLAAACGGSLTTDEADDAPSPHESVSPSPAPESLPLPAYSPAPYVEHDLAPGEPPMWSLSLAETKAIEYAWLWGEDSQSALDAGLPDGCFGVNILYENGAEPPDFDRCMVATYASKGVSDAALELYRERLWTIFDVQGQGPVWVAAFDMWKPGAQDIIHSAQAIFTPSGVFEADLGLAARDEAFASPIADAIQAALNARNTNTDAGYQAGTTPGYHVFGPPVQTEDGWIVPLVMNLYGCMACDTEFAVKVAFDFTSTGEFTGVRSLGFCWDELRTQRVDTPTTDAIEELLSSLPTCTSAPGAETLWWAAVLDARPDYYPQW